MSFHPDSYDGFEEGDYCPYCGQHGFDWMGNSLEESGVSAFFRVTRCRCCNCGEMFAMVEVEETYPYGTIPAESIFEEYGWPLKSKSPRARPKAKTAAKPKTKRRC